MRERARVESSAAKESVSGVRRNSRLATRVASSRCASALLVAPKGVQMVYDVVILGSGISGSILAAILARHGVKTLLIDHGQHPRFTIGESMIPGTSALLRIMADRYDVPELEYVSTFRSLRRHVTASSGMKRNFS